ncbi:hypothetical protein ACFZCK_11315 [Kitasatospora purpeofusca]|uniref:hypothetical protein n=1 Tax=Kitasatospora purpeofusca TaxID=67352 RepID=UPI0036E4FEBA
MSEYFFYAAHRGSGPLGNGVSAIDPATGEVTATVAIGSVKVRDVIARPGGKQLLVLVDDRADLRVVDLGTLAVTAALDIANKTWERYERLLSSPDGSRLFAQDSMQVDEIDPATGAVLGAHTLPFGPSYRPVFSPDGRYLYGASYAGSVCRLDLETGERSEGETHLGIGMGNVVVSPDGKHLYTANPASNSVLWKLDAASLEVLAKAEVDRPAAVVRLSADGRTLYAGNGGGHSTAYDTDLRRVPGTQEDEYDSGFSRPYGLDIGITSPDGTRVAGFTPTWVYWGPAQSGSTDRGSADSLPGDVVALTTAAAPTPQSTRLEVSPVRALAPITIPGLSARLTTTDGTPVPGAALRFTSAGGIDLGTATTDTTGRATLDAELRLPLNPATGAIDTSRLTGPYQVTYTGQGSYPPATGHGDITLG